ncbi:hypothetical protein QC764_0047120 [Podospora pseudoanserina]|uniref:Uncharacterized protein n=1 Tax=Podospora pseudoanserina TaxID=2609844 RepID=A0ABR0IB79_9PEZI|nr:hypothetical protein QC764_0047120 [Podospora pseudoanserina]
MGYEWNGDPTILIVVIACSVCFGWVPIITVVSIVRHCRARLRAKRGSNGTNSDAESQGGRPSTAPDVPKPLQTYHPSSTKGLERSASSRTRSSADGYDLKRVDTNSSWNPIRHSFHYDNESLWGGDGLSRSNSRHRPPYFPTHVHNTTPSLSRPASIRSVASSHRQQSRSRRSSMASNSDNAPAAFQINDTYYDTTPLPNVTRTVNPVVASSSTPTSSKGPGQSPQQRQQKQPKQDNPHPPQRNRRRRHSLDARRDSDSLTRDISRPNTSMTRREVEEYEDLDNQKQNATHRSHRPPRPGSASRRGSHPAPGGSEETDDDLSMAGALPPAKLPPRRASLHAQTFERPAWLDEEPHAM